MEFDVWSNADRKLVATPVEAKFVDNSNAPYGFEMHEIRIEAI